MTEPPAHSWTCPSCGRGVPLRISTCHCGMSRQHASEIQATAAPPHARSVASTGSVGIWRSLPRDLKALVVAAALVLGAGCGWMLFGPPPAPIHPLLGYVEAGARPSPPPVPPFKLPWWR